MGAADTVSREDLQRGRLADYIIPTSRGFLGNKRITGVTILDCRSRVYVERIDKGKWSSDK